jgi:hypothetical protein
MPWMNRIKRNKIFMIKICVYLLELEDIKLLIFKFYLTSIAGSLALTM